MQIKFIGGQENVVIRDIEDVRFNRWAMGEVKDVPDHDIAVPPTYGTGETTRNAIEAVLNAGPNFVDATTGKNPLYTCSKCGGTARDDFFRHNDQSISYAAPDEKPLCLGCFLIDNPQHLDDHIRRGMPSDVRHRVETAIAAAAPVKTPPPAPIPPAPPTPISQAPIAPAAAAEHEG